MSLKLQRISIEINASFGNQAQEEVALQALETVMDTWSRSSQGLQRHAKKRIRYLIAKVEPFPRRLP
jgi:hypothetical protein